MTFPILIEIEDPQLAAVLRLLSNYPGVAKIHMDFDQLTGPRGARRGIARPRKEQQADEHLPAIQDVVIAFLMQGPKTVGEIADEIKRVGHEGLVEQAKQALVNLKEKGITESAGRGIHQLTQMARDKLNGGGAAPAIALPPPAPEEKKRRAMRTDALAITHRAVIEAHPDPVSAADVAQKIGATTKAASNDLYRLKKQGLIRRIAKGRYGLTKKGQANPPADSTTETKEVNHG